MLLWLKNIIHSVLDWYDTLKGTRYFKLKRIHDSVNDGYIIETDQGFKLYIYCKEYVYVCIYLSRWARNKELSIYHVYCVFSPGTPDDIKAKFSSELKISTFLNSWSSKEYQKMQAIKVYVDLVLKNQI